MGGLLDRFDALAAAVDRACREVYGERLVALALFGSVARRTPRPDSDLDLLLVAGDLPDGRTARLAEFSAVEERLRPALAAARRGGVDTRLSPIFKTPAEAEAGSPLFLDLVEDARVLADPRGFLAARLARVAARLRTLGARRIWRGDAWFWDLKPDYRPGEEFEL